MTRHLPSSTTLAGLIAAILLPIGLLAEPTVKDVVISHRPGAKLVDVFYSVSGADQPVNIVALGHDGDSGTDIPMTTIIDDALSSPVENGRHHFVWNAGKDWNNELSRNFTVRLSAERRAAYVVVDISEGPTAQL